MDEYPDGTKTGITLAIIHDQTDYALEVNEPVDVYLAGVLEQVIDARLDGTFTHDDIPFVVEQILRGLGRE